MDVDDVPAALGSRPDWPSEVRPQMVGQLLNLAHFLDTPLPDPRAGYRSAQDLV